MFLVGSGFRISNDDAVGSSRSYVVLLREMNRCCIGFELVRVLVGSFEDSHGPKCWESADSMRGKSESGL